MDKESYIEISENQKNRIANILGSLIEGKAIVVASLITAVVTLVGIYVSRQPILKQPEPRFVVNDPLLNPYERRLYIEPDNKAAERKEPLHIRYDGTEFTNAGIPLPGDFIWSVDLETLLSKYPVFLENGQHTVEVRFPGGPWSEPKKITLRTEQAPLAAEINTSSDDPETTKIAGAVKVEGTDPKETLRVNIYFDHHGEPEWVPLDVTRKINQETGEAYFIFATDVLKIPRIPPDDPRYEQDFFLLEVIDRAGTVTRQSLSYNLFATPGKSRFGIEGPQQEALIELVRGWHDGQHSEFISEFKFIPVTRSISKGSQAHPAFNLSVNQFAQNLKTINKLHWTDLPPVKRRDQPLTIILRNDRQIGATFDNKFSDDKASSPGGKTKYQVFQRGRDGILYKSNPVESPFPPETFKLTVRASPKESTIRLLHSDITYAEGVELPVGDYVVEIIREGYVTDQRNVGIVDRDVTLTVKLEPKEKKYALTINATPSDSTIKIMNIGPKYYPGMLLAPGRYDVMVERKGYVTWRQKITFKETALTKKNHLKRLPETYKLTIKAEPTDSTITIVDSKYDYKSGIDLPPGNYSIRVEKKGYHPLTQNVSIKDKAVSRYVRLEINKDEPVGLRIVPDKVHLEVNQRLELKIRVQFADGSWAYAPSEEVVWRIEPRTIQMQGDILWGEEQLEGWVVSQYNLHVARI